jgi:hypothetical protein
MARFVFMLLSLLAFSSLSKAAWLSQSGLRCVSHCEIRENDVALPPSLRNASVCSIDESLSLSCPYCVDGPNLDGICQGRCIDLCEATAVATSTHHQIHRRFGFFDDVSNFYMANKVFLTRMLWYRLLARLVSCSQASQMKLNGSWHRCRKAYR